MTTWTPSNEAVERAARAMAERKGYNIVRLKAGHYENDAQTWDDYIDDAITALIAGHEDAVVVGKPQLPFWVLEFREKSPCPRYWSGLKQGYVYEITDAVQLRRRIDAERLLEHSNILAVPVEHVMIGTDAVLIAGHGPAAEDRIKQMVSRFLCWQLPDDFSPDGGISFQKIGNEGGPHEYVRKPSGTNLLDATQAEAMVRHLLAANTAPQADDDPWVLMRKIEAENARLREALEIIAKRRQCLDNLMSNQDIAIAALNGEKTK